jgi:alpha-D-ribose 1-methylphosphonate 5-triphosphate synthase subunit PhnG
MRGNDSAADTVGRQALMRACAEASEAELEAALSALGGPTAAEELRPPQTGLVMLRGRIGGSGPSFNVGEATVTRAALRLETGAVGFSYRSHHRARLAALIDAMGQDAECRTLLEAHLVAPVTARRAAADARTRAEAAATKVDFFTLVRGED